MSDQAPPTSRKIEPASLPHEADPALPRLLPPGLVLQVLGATGSGLPYAGGQVDIGETHIALAGASVQQTRLWQGQFPPPEAIERFEKVLPGAFDRLITMAEHLQAAQVEEDKRAHDYTRADARRGHWLGFTSTVLAIVASVGVTIAGYPWIGVALVSVPVMGVAKALIDSTRGKRTGFASADGQPPPAQSENPSS